MKDIKIGQKIYFLSQHKHKIKIYSGKVVCIKVYGCLIKKRLIKTDYFELDYEDVFVDKNEAIEYLRTEISRLLDENE